MKESVKRVIDRSKVREMCIRHDYYTCGNCEEYEAMLNYVDEIDADNIHEMKVVAENIFCHCAVDKFLSEYNCSEDEFKDNILWCLYNECCTTRIMEVRWI